MKKQGDPTYYVPHEDAVQLARMMFLAGVTLGMALAVISIAVIMAVL